MDEKCKILNAWIVVEKLSEGTIDIKKQEMLSFDEKVRDWEEHFRDFLAKNKEKKNIDDEDFENSGIVFFFNIFDFSKVITILENDNHKKLYEEIKDSKKFTFAVYFDNQLKFQGNKFFYTMSGYILKHKIAFEDIRKEEENFLKVEDEIRNYINGKFAAEDFNTAFSHLLNKYQIDIKNSRYKFVRDMQYDEVNLHSFFIQDLEKAKCIHTDNLEQYFSGESNHRINLDSNKNSPRFKPEVFEEILQPEKYPKGRFPSNADYALSFMQQVATNIALNKPNNIRTVNGPPGTGKTTILKDIFADMLVQQAVLISQLPDKEMSATLPYWDNAKLGVLPDSIADKNIIVASSNNGAVQNIVHELPQISNIDEAFLGKLMEADYFKNISNSEIELELSEDSRELKVVKKKEKNWGTFSLEGGASKNIRNLLYTIEVIEKELEDVYQPDRRIYQSFLDLYKELMEKQQEVQKYYQCLKELKNIESNYREEKETFVKEKENKSLKLDGDRKIVLQEKEKLEKEKLRVQNELDMIPTKYDILKNKIDQAERNYEQIQFQRPRFRFLQKIINPSKFNQYLEDSKQANQRLNEVKEQEIKLLESRLYYENQLKECEKKLQDIQQEIKDMETAFHQWMEKEQNKLKGLEEKADKSKKIIEGINISAIDFSKTYEDLQKSNPWYDREFRIKQTNLFIMSLKVRKQFLYENRKNLRKARHIWIKREEYHSEKQILNAAWQWLNFTIPVISTTFASFGTMFKNLPENSIANLFIDEAGQALPQASVGAIFRSKKIMAVGDPAQIKPVLTLSSGILNLIRRHYDVSEKFISADASTQTLMDAVSQYGFQKSQEAEDWIGIPLWVHRRSNYPMFTISNRISYNNLMVQGKPEDKARGKADWFHIGGIADDKFVKEQADFLKEQIRSRIEKDPGLKDKIYVISPFHNVANKLAMELEEIKFTKRKDGKAVNVGTVHTFQGKEAKIVYLVLGADRGSEGAALWAVSEPNIMNVAATRAKEEFYIIGDKALYAGLKNQVVNKTLAVIEEYNEKE